MKIFVTAKPSSKRRLIEKVDANHFVIAVKEAPYKGYANKAIEEALADFYDLPKSKVFLVSGATSKQKVFEVLT